MNKTLEFPDKMLIGGKCVSGTSGHVIPAIDPSTEAVIANIPKADERDVEMAVDAARRALPAWRRLGVDERAAFVNALAAAIEREAETLAAIEATDSGNPIKSARGDVAGAIEKCRYFAGISGEVKGEVLTTNDSRLNYTVREPYGVVGIITPWNHPIWEAVNLAPAILAGNTVVLKPSEETSLSTLELGRLIAAALPPGVVNIVSGYGPEAGAAIVRHPAVRRVAFTGGVDTGREILRMAADKIMGATLELGGKNANIVFPDADLDAAVDGAFAAMNLGFQGQSCASGSRLFLHESVRSHVIDKLVARFEAVRVGPPLDPTTEMGPLASRPHQEKVTRYVSLGRHEGAAPLAGGDRPPGERFSKGYYLRPAIFDRVKPGMAIAQHEIFGPVLSVLTWDDVDDLIDQANALPYGLAAYVWTRDLTVAHRMAREIQAGTVWINQGPVWLWGAPFGGHKQSGMGTSCCLDALLEYTQVKNVNVRLGTLN